MSKMGAARLSCAMEDDERAAPSSAACFFSRNLAFLRSRPASFHMEDSLSTDVHGSIPCSPDHREAAGPVGPAAGRPHSVSFVSTWNIMRSDTLPAYGSDGRCGRRLQKLTSRKKICPSKPFPKAAICLGEMGSRLGLLPLPIYRY